VAKRTPKVLKKLSSNTTLKTGIAPATALNGYPLKTKLPEIFDYQDQSGIEERDRQAKSKMKFYAERRRNIKDSNLKPGDNVLMKNVTKRGKLVSKFQSEPFQVIKTRGSMITAQRGDEIKTRNSSHFRSVETGENPLRAVAEPEEPYPIISDMADPQTAQSNDRDIIRTRATPSREIRDSPRTPNRAIPPRETRAAQPPPKPPQILSPPRQSPRPQRVRNMPSYLRDYEVKLPKK